MTWPGFASKEMSVQHRAFRRVAERDVLKGDSSGEPRRLDGVRPALHFDRRVEHFKHAPRGGEALLHGIGDGRNVRDLPGELLEQAGEHHQAAAQRNFSLHIQPAAVGEQNHQAQLRQHLRAGREDGQIPENSPLLRGHFVVRLLETGGLGALRRQSLSPFAFRARFR